MKNICPPGVFCITPGLLIVAAVVVGVCAYLLLPKIHSFDKGLLHKYMAQTPLPINLNVTTTSEGDGRYMRAPRPQRMWETTPDLRGVYVGGAGVPVMNVPTRGLPESYQTMGLLKTTDGQLLPLYGRRTASRSDRFNYYTRTDTNNPISLPINYKRRDCQDDVGCDELSNGETIRIAPTGQEAEATIYRFDGPMYVPGLV